MNTSPPKGWTLPLILQLAFDFVIMLATITYAVFAIKQWSAMNGQLAQMTTSGTQTDRMLGLVQKQVEQLTKQAAESHDLAVAAKLQSDNTAKLANAAVGQLSVMRSQAENQRPWIEAMGDELKEWQISITGSNPKSFTVYFKFDVRNTGVSPARIVHEPRFVLSDISKPEDRFWNQDLCVPTNDKFRFYDPIFENAETKIGAAAEKSLNPTEIERLYDYLSGCVLYYGPTGDVHKLRLIYRVEYSPETTMYTNKIGYHKIKSITLASSRTDAYHGNPN